MSKISLTPAASGTGVFTLASPATNTDRTLTLPDNTGTLLSTASTSIIPTGSPAFSAYQSTAQTGISYNTFTKVTFTSIDFDTNSNFSSSRFTPTVAGYYQISAAVTIPYPASTGLIVVAMYKNGSNYKLGNVIQGNTTFYPTSTVSSIVYMNGSTDYIEIYISGGNNGGAYQTWNGTTNTYFNGALVRGA